MDRLLFSVEEICRTQIFKSLPGRVIFLTTLTDFAEPGTYYTRPAVLVRHLVPWWANLDRNLVSDSGERVFLNDEFCGPLLIFLALNREWCLSVPPQFPFDPTLASRQLRGTQVRGTRVCRSLVQFNGIRGRYR